MCLIWYVSSFVKIYLIPVNGLDCWRIPPFFFRGEMHIMAWINLKMLHIYTHNPLVGFVG